MTDTVELQAFEQEDILSNEILVQVYRERIKQISKGWTPEHDDEHDDDSICNAAIAYAIPPSYFLPTQFWPLHWDFKPKSRRENLIRSIALLVAEVERLDRAALKEINEGSSPVTNKGDSQGHTSGV